MRLNMTAIATAVIALPPGSGVGQIPLSCHVRGPQQWLATRPSPLDSVSVTVDGKTAKICYSRPSARGRSVDSLVPPGLAWRLGANEPTTITLTDRLSVGGGTHTGTFRSSGRSCSHQVDARLLYTPDTEPAKMFQNMEQVASGTGQVERTAEPIEQFTIRSEGDRTSCDLVFEWGTWRVRIPVQPAS
jgi:DUF2911 family protein